MNGEELIITSYYKLPSMLDITDMLNKLFILSIIIAIGLIVSWIIQIYIDYRLRLVEKKLGINKWRKREWF